MVILKCVLVLGVNTTQYFMAQFSDLFLLKNLTKGSEYEVGSLHMQRSYCESTNCIA